jgi:hypothetical protein
MVWDEYKNDRISINDIVEWVSKNHSASEVEKKLQHPEDTASSLYVLSELPADLVRPLWRSILPCMATDDVSIKFYCLDILHTFVEEATADEIVAALALTDLSQPLLFGKMYALIVNCSEEALGRALCAANQTPSVDIEHIAGLNLLASRKPVTDSELLARLCSESLTSVFYASCFVGRYRLHVPHLLSNMPKVTRRFAEVERAHPAGHFPLKIAEPI